MKKEKLEENNDGKILKGTNKYRHMNHYHELTNEQKIVDFGTGKFVADKKMIPLLKTLNEIGLTTRSHCYGHESKYSFVGIIFDNDLSIGVHELKETNSGRKFPKGAKELIIHWKRKN